jgi:hypothetical protein
MAKAQAITSKLKESKEPRDKKPKEKDRKNKKGAALVGRVKKVIKRSRRKLSEEKFEKQLQRTIAFLEELQARLVESNRPVKQAVKQAVKQSVKQTGKRKNLKSKRKTKPGDKSANAGISVASMKTAAAAAAKSVKKI